MVNTTVNAQTSTIRRMNRWWIFSLVMVFLTGTLFTLWVGQSEDARMRRDLLTTARLISKTVKAEEVALLSGSEADLKSPIYQRIKNELILIRSASSRCRFIYLMGNKEDGTLYFLVDSEPEHSQGYSPPGQVYPEASAEDKKVFVANREAVIGPMRDRWGTWISALVPVRDLGTGELVAVLGMDVDAREWRRSVAIQYVPAVAVTLLFALLLTTFFHVQRRTVLEKLRIAASEAALAESERKYRSVVESIQDVFLRVDSDGNLVMLSPSAAGVLGYGSTQELLGRSASLLWMRPSEWDEMTAEIRKSGEVRDWEFLARRKDETSVVMSATFHQIRSEKNQSGGFEGICRDITERKRTAEDKLQMQRRLLHAQKLESLGVLAGGIAHDFNNLLMVIMGNLEMAQEALPPEATNARLAIEQAEQGARRASDITRQMLAYSGKGQFVIKNLNLSLLVEENARMLRAAISKTITLSLQLDPKLPLIRADEGQIQQVIMNLMTNAAESIEEGPGQVFLMTGVQECDEEYLRQSRLEKPPAAGKYVFLEVSDNGCGMDENTRQRLFEPFFTTKFAGRGLGMSAVLGIVQGHQGAILVNSEVGKGTSIRVLFPIPAIDPEAPVEPEKPEEVQFRKWDTATQTGTVLVVDDEELILKVSKAMLEELGFRVRTASDGEEAVQLFTREKDQIDCVILDLTMPRMDGIATLKELRRVQPDVKIILSSGYNEQDVSGRMEDKIYAGFIQKPYKLQGLQNELERVLAKPV